MFCPSPLMMLLGAALHCADVASQFLEFLFQNDSLGSDPAAAACSHGDLLLRSLFKRVLYATNCTLYQLLCVLKYFILSKLSCALYIISFSQQWITQTSFQSVLYNTFPLLFSVISWNGLNICGFSPNPSVAISALNMMLIGRRVFKSWLDHMTKHPRIEWVSLKESPSDNPSFHTCKNTNDRHHL